jgi:SWI/SNF-related matrix-associated actin-dependent regulator 1 of chromatin subfamily A
VIILNSNRHPIRILVRDERAVFEASYVYKDMAKACGFKWDVGSRQWAASTDFLRACIQRVSSLVSLDPVEITEWLAGRDHTTEDYPEHPALEWALALLKITPYDYQKNGINYALHNPYSVIGSEMGLGKTMQALGVMAVSGLKSLVICPAFLKINWAREVAKFTGMSALVIGKAKELAKYSHADLMKYDVLIINYDIVDRCIKCFIGRDFFVFDEAHRLKNYNAKRSEFCRDMIMQTKPKRLLFLTGTAIKNHVGEFFHLIFLCSQSPVPVGIRIHEEDSISTEYRFKEFFSHREDAAFGSKFTGLKNYPILRALLKHKYVRHSAGEHLKGLPEIVRQQALAALIEKGEVEEIDRALREALSEMRRQGKGEHLSQAKQMAALAKVPSTTAYVLNLVEQDEKVVVFSDHVAPAEMLAAAFNEKGIKAVLITGKVPMEKRQACVDSFVTGDAMVFVATVGAAKEGLTLVSGRYLVFNDLPWVPADYLQAEKRVHRIGQRKQVHVTAMAAPGLDAAICGTLVKKTEVIVQVLSGGKEENPLGWLKDLDLREADESWM